MNTLQKFYDNKDKTLTIAQEAIENLKETTARSLGTVSIGAPYVIGNHIAISLYENLITYNTDLTPNTKPAIGMAIGSFLEKDDKDYLSLNLNVCIPNMAFMRIARIFEQQLIDWYNIQKEVEPKLTLLIELLGKAKLDKKIKDALHIGDSCGLSLTETPSPAFVKSLEAISKRTSFSKEIKTLAGELLNQCLPYSTLAKDMKALRDKMSTKGHLELRDGKYLTMSSPSGSAGAQWFQNTSGDITDAIPTGNNLFFLCANAGYLNDNFAVMTTKHVKESITFLVDPSMLEQIQKVVDSDRFLKKKASEYVCHPTDTAETAYEKSFAWSGITNTAIADSVAKIVSNFMGNTILGLYIDMTTENFILRPVVSETCFSTNPISEEIGEAKITDFQPLIARYDTGYVFLTSSLDKQTV